MFEGVTDTFILIIFIEKYIESLNWVAKIINILCIMLGPSYTSSYCSCIYNCLLNRCLSSQTLWIRISLSIQHYVDKVCHWLPTGRWFSPSTTVSSTNETDRHDITEILLKVALNTIIIQVEDYVRVCSTFTDYIYKQISKYLCTF